MRHLFRQRIRQRVIVTLKDERSFAGVLFDADPELIILRNSEALSRDGSRVHVDGELLLLRGDIAFIQRP